MTPDQHGYVKCESCGCWRKPEDVHEHNVLGLICNKDAECSESFETKRTAEQKVLAMRFRA